jgi:hypothetical protein
MNILKSWEFPQKAWIIILTQSTLILFLFSWLLVEYESNPFMQQYLTNLAPTIAPVLSLAFGVLAAMTATILYVRFRRVKAAGDRLDTIPRSTQSHRTHRKRVTAKPSTTKIKDDLQPIMLPIPRFIITESKPSQVAEERKQDSTPSPTPTEAAKESEVKPNQ